MSSRHCTRSWHPPAAVSCPDRDKGLQVLGVNLNECAYVVALAGNPNTGKSTVFNALTGLRQHVGNWPGKTVTRAEGAFDFNGTKYKLVDLPGTYSLLTASTDEEIARDFLLFGRPHCTVIVVDATVLERNLNLVLQILEITDRAVVCLNLMDEARRKGFTIDHTRLAGNLGVPVIAVVARTGSGIPALIGAVAGVCAGAIRTHPHRVGTSGVMARSVDELASMIHARHPNLSNARWVAMRLLEGDARVERALHSGELEALAAEQQACSVKGRRYLAVIWP